MMHVSALIVAIVAISAPLAAGADTGDDVWFDFEQPTGVLVTVNNLGTAPTTQRVVSSRGGVAQAVPSFPGSGNAVDFPAFDGSRTGPRVAIAVTNAGTGDGLAPTTLPFSFGADVRRDAVNSGTNYDDGNNVLQRGLCCNESQYKLQVDDDEVSCRIRGQRGAVTVTSPASLLAGEAYRLSCSRTVGTTQDTVTLVVTPIAADGTLGAPVTTTARRAVGRLSFATGTPLSIGAKLNPNRTISSSSDQFNGVIDNAWLAIG
jgi:hypothetical protein